MTKKEFMAFSLPYKVSFRIEYGTTNQPIGDYLLTGCYDSGVIDGVNYNANVKTDKYKPIIRHISDITKPCVQADYNNGEPFVPISELKKICYGLEYTTYNSNCENEELFIISSCGGQSDDYFYFSEYIKAFMMLISWHFWPDMPEGEEVVYVTEEFNPYK
jgi:hypothetical protein